MLLWINGLWKHITEDTHSVDDKDWDAVEEMLLGILEMYTQKDIWTTIVDDIWFTSCKQKWDKLKQVYGGVGSMSMFNTWVALMGTALDKANPMLPQLQQLNDSHITLKNNDMKITDLPFSFILIKALPESYSAVGLTILATGALKNLSLQMIQEWILNEEG